MDDLNSNSDSAISTIEEYNEVLPLFFDALPDPVLVIEENGKIIKALGGIASGLYPNTDTLEGRFIEDIFNCDLAEKFQLAITDAISTNKMLIIEYEVDTEAMGLDSSHRWFEGRVQPIKQRGDDNRFVLWTTINKTENKLLEQKLLELSITDPLTTAYNRRYFNDNLANLLAMHERYPEVFSLLLVDVDHFKNINDTYGHDIGDSVLVRLVELCNDFLRDIDILARFGGEEFMIILPNTNARDACVVANRIRVIMEQDEIVTNAKNVHYTVSIGVTDVKASGDNIDSLSKRVDLALYRAKRSGRNKVCYNGE